MAQFFKPVETPVSTRQETHSLTNVNDVDLSYTLVDRTDTTDKLTNYVVSFNLPHDTEAFSSGSTLSMAKPEMQQLNVDQFIFSPIKKEDYNEIIDGRSLTFTFPQFSGVTALSAKTILSTTYTKTEKKEDNELLGTNVAFLFCDEINLPYTGETSGGLISKSAVTSWDATTSYINRPPATSYLELKNDDVNTDQRDYSNVNLAVPVPEEYPTNTNQGYNYDIPVGFIALDKGFVVLTHPSIVNSFPWTLGQKSDGSSNAGASSATTGVYFSSTTASNLEFVDINIEYKTSVVALIFPGEFFWSTNPTWDTPKNYQEQQNSTFGYDAVSISEIGLFNSKKELVSIAKLDRPLVKQYNDLVTFNLDINV